MSSKFNNRRPKYTPPKVCKKSKRGPQWPVSSTDCPGRATIKTIINFPDDVPIPYASKAIAFTMTKKRDDICQWFFNENQTDPLKPSGFVKIDVLTRAILVQFTVPTGGGGFILWEGDLLETPTKTGVIAEWQPAARFILPNPGKPISVLILS